MVKKIMRITVLAGVLSFMAFGTPDRAVSAQAAEKTVTINTGNYRGGKAIQEAFDTQAASDGTDELVVKLEPGTYNITESLIVYSLSLIHI